MQIRGVDPTFLYYFNIFFKKTFVVSKILFTFAPVMPAHVRVGTLKTYIDGTRPQAICTASLERAFS